MPILKNGTVWHRKKSKLGTFLKFNFFWFFQSSRGIRALKSLRQRKERQRKKRNDDRDVGVKLVLSNFVLFFNGTLRCAFCKKVLSYNHHVNKDVRYPRMCIIEMSKLGNCWNDTLSRVKKERVYSHSTEFPHKTRGLKEPKENHLTNSIFRPESIANSGNNWKGHRKNCSGWWIAVEVFV